MGMTIEFGFNQIGFAKKSSFAIEGTVHNESYRRQEFEIINRIGFKPTETTKLTGHNNIRFTIKFPKSKLNEVVSELKTKARYVSNFSVTYDGLMIKNCHIEGEYAEGDMYCIDIYSKRTSHY